MAGTRVVLDIVTDEIGPAIERLLGFVGGKGMNLALDDIGEALLTSTRDRAAREVDPSGNAWAPLSPRYKKLKDKKRPGVPRLKFDNHMLGDQLSHQVINNDLFVGTNAKYGAIHQFGGSIQIAARSQLMGFHQDKRTGEVGNRFASRKKANFEQWATLPAHEIKMPARPWLGLSTEDDAEALAILGDHLQAAVKGG